MSREQRILNLIERTKERISSLEDTLGVVMMPTRWHFTVGMLEINKILLKELENLL